MDDDIVIVKSSHFDISMLRASLSVLSLPHKAIPKCAYWLMREYCTEIQGEESVNSGSVTPKKEFGLLLSDDEGLTLIVETSKIPLVQYLVQPEEYTISPSFWKAFYIGVRGAAIEVPGAVYYLADALSKEGLSILHISTFESEVFLIQEPDLERACKILQEFQDPNRFTQSHGDKLNAVTKTESTLNDSGLNSNDVENNEGKSGTSRHLYYDLDQNTSLDHEEDDDVQDNLDLSWITPQVRSTISFQLPISESQLSIPWNAKFEEGFSLSVIPSSMVMAKSSRQDMKLFSDKMVKMILFDPRYSQFYESFPSSNGTNPPPESGPFPKLKPQQSEYFLASEDSTETFPRVRADGGISNSNDIPTTATPSMKGFIDKATFMFGFWFVHDEVTFLMHEADLSYFNADQLIISPQQWKAIKLCGRPIAFNETGVVSAMSQIDTNIPSLNISTAQTNCTLVPYELLPNTLEELSTALNCPVRKLNPY